jgi:hypothetical protein
MYNCFQSQVSTGELYSFETGFFDFIHNYIDNSYSDNNVDYNPRSGSIELIKMGIALNEFPTPKTSQRFNSANLYGLFNITGYTNNWNKHYKLWNDYCVFSQPEVYASGNYTLGYNVEEASRYSRISFITPPYSEGLDDLSWRRKFVWRYWQSGTEIADGLATGKEYSDLSLVFLPNNPSGVIDSGNFTGIVYIDNEFYLKNVPLNFFNNPTIVSIVDPINNIVLYELDEWSQYGQNNIDSIVSKPINWACDLNEVSLNGHRVTGVSGSGVSSAPANLRFYTNLNNGKKLKLFDITDYNTLSGNNPTFPQYIQNSFLLNVDLYWDFSRNYSRLPAVVSGGYMNQYFYPPKLSINKKLYYKNSTERPIGTSSYYNNYSLIDEKVYLYDKFNQTGHFPEGLEFFYKYRGYPANDFAYRTNRYQSYSYVDQDQNQLSTEIDKNIIYPHNHTQTKNIGIRTGENCSGYTNASEYTSAENNNFYYQDLIFNPDHITSAIKTIYSMNDISLSYDYKQALYKQSIFLTGYTGLNIINKIGLSGDNFSDYSQYYTSDTGYSYFNRYNYLNDFKFSLSLYGLIGRTISLNVTGLFNNYFELYNNKYRWINLDIKGGYDMTYGSSYESLAVKPKVVSYLDKQTYIQGGKLKTGYFINLANGEVNYELFDNKIIHGREYDFADSNIIDYIKPKLVSGYNFLSGYEDREFCTPSIGNNIVNIQYYGGFWINKSVLIEDLEGQKELRNSFKSGESLKIKIPKIVNSPNTFYQTSPNLFFAGSSLIENANSIGRVANYYTYYNYNYYGSDYASFIKRIHLCRNNTKIGKLEPSGSPDFVSNYGDKFISDPRYNYLTGITGQKKSIYNNNNYIRYDDGDITSGILDDENPFDDYVIYNSAGRENKNIKMTPILYTQEIGSDGEYLPANYIDIGDEFSITISPNDDWVIYNNEKDSVIYWRKLSGGSGARYASLKYDMSYEDGEKCKDNVEVRVEVQNDYSLNSFTPFYAPIYNRILTSDPNKIKTGSQPGGIPYSGTLNPFNGQLDTTMLDYEYSFLHTAHFSANTTNHINRIIQRFTGLDDYNK